MYFTVNGVEFQLLNWNFREDGTMGGIYFLVPKGIYKHINGGNNGAYVYDYPSNPEFDEARAACPCFDVDGVYEDDFGKCSLNSIVNAAAEFIDLNIPRV